MTRIRALPPFHLFLSPYTLFPLSLETGSPNSCDALRRPVFINEISPYGKFIELYDGGLGQSSLDALLLLLLVDGYNVPYSVIPITGNRTDR